MTEPFETPADSRRLRVDHWRAGIVWPQAPPGNFLRIGLALGTFELRPGDVTLPGRCAPPPP